MIVPLVVMPLVMPVDAADVSGVWSLRLLTSGGETATRATVTLKQAGATLTGTCAIDQTDQELTVAGEAAANALAWRCTGKGGFEVSFTGAIDASERQMTGEWSTHSSVHGTFKGSKPPK